METTFQDDPREVLGIGPEAGDEEIRAAYLKKVKENPPDTAPREFERVRDAYEILRDPRRRMQQLLFSGDPMPPLVQVIDGQRAPRRFTGPKPWLAALKEK
jgi:curved DNA-binding protein CbpA